jgi:5-methylcytosine-specific restriction endonuclease McrA
LKIKQCFHCKTDKPVTEFIKDKYKKSGYKSTCLACNRVKANSKLPLDAPRKRTFDVAMSSSEYSKLWATENPKRRHEIDVKSRNNPINRQKRAAQMRYYRLQNPTAYKDWKFANPEKANANWNRRRQYFNTANLYQVTKNEILKLYNANCFYCGSSEEIQIDHVMPISRGGKHSIGNLVAACGPCNRQKHSKTVMEWRKWKTGHDTKTI